MGWDTITFMQVHGPFGEVIHFQNETPWFFGNRGGDYKMWKGAYEKIIPPEGFFSYDWWECVNVPNDEEEQKQVQEYYKIFRTHKVIYTQCVPTLYSLAARTITNDIYSFQQALKNIPLFMLHFIFSQHSSSNLIRLKFTYPELNNSEKRKTCTKVDDLVELSRKYTGICLHVNMWDDFCDHKDYRVCIRKGKKEHERIRYGRINPQHVRDSTIHGNTRFDKDVCDVNYFANVDSDVLEALRKGK